MDHVGIDVHKGASQICVIAEGGELIEQRVRTEPARLAQALEGRVPARIVLEASTESEWVARCLEQLGHEVIVADPNFAPMYATRQRTVKTDRRDARALADACGLGAYRRAHRLSDAQRHVRGRLGVRDALVRTRTRYIALIRARLRQEGWRVPTGTAERFSHRVLALPRPGGLRSEVAPLLAVIRQVTQQVDYLDERIAALTQADARVRRLRSVPTIGPVTAAAFVAALHDAHRFGRAHEVEAYVGLVPREWSSGETQRRADHQSGVGASAVPADPGRGVDAAPARLRDPRTAERREWAGRIAARRGKKIAVVALARRLAWILFALLRDGTVYEPRASQATPGALRRAKAAGANS